MQVFHSYFLAVRILNEITKIENTEKCQNTENCDRGVSVHLQQAYFNVSLSLLLLTAVQSQLHMSSPSEIVFLYRNKMQIKRV